jgi:hypothetical protein
MIRVDLSVLVLVYLFATVVALFSVWVFHEWGRRRRLNQVLRYRVRCTICASIFEDKTGGEVTRCPQCGSLNQRVKFGGF